MMVPARIGFDLDGVLADLDAAMTEVAERLFGTAPQPLPSDATDLDIERDAGEAASDPPGTDSAVRRPSRGREIWREIRGRENFWETLTEAEPGIVARLAALADEHDWEIVFLTQRPPTAGATVQRQSQRWLAGLGFSYPSVCVVDGSRGKVADALGLDLVVDDRSENCLDVVTDSKAKAVLIWHSDQPHVAQNARRFGIEVAGSIGECLDELAAGRWLPTSQKGLVGRLRRWFNGSSAQPG